MSGYAELAVTSNFSFLRGGSHPEELAAQTTELGLTAIGIADRNKVAGLGRADSVAKERGLEFPPGARLLPGVRLVFADGTPEILAYPNCLSGWSNLTRLLTIGKRRAEKGECELYLTDLLERASGLSLIVVLSKVPALPLRVGGREAKGPVDLSPPGARNFELGREISGRGHIQRVPLPERVLAPRALPRSTLPQGEGRKGVVTLLHQLREAADAPVRLAASMLYRGDDARRLERLASLAAEAEVRLIATNEVLYHHPDRRPLQDDDTA